MAIEIIKPGLLSTVQDLGRHGFQHAGVSAGGAMDPFALQAANLMLGNREDAAAIEMTLHGAVLTFHQETWICICGADMSAKTSDGASIPLWRPVAVKAGTVLSFGTAVMGCRTYLAVSGGLQIAPVMNSASTDVRAGIGGVDGRPLQKGDVLPCLELTAYEKEKLTAAFQRLHHAAYAASGTWFLSPSALPDYNEKPVIRMMRGHEADKFSHDALKTLLTSKYRISPSSNRMGYRLEGEPLKRVATGDMLSEAVTAGTVQVPPSGEPIILMSERQTTGGYPRIAQVAQADLPVLAQTKPGDIITFEEISLLEAERLLLNQAFILTQLRIAARLRWLT